MWDDRCPHKCDYCESIDDAAEEVFQEQRRRWRETVDKDSWEYRTWEAYVGAALHAENVFDRIGFSDGPVTFRVWGDLAP